MDDERPAQPCSTICRATKRTTGFLWLWPSHRGDCWSEDGCEKIAFGTSPLCLEYMSWCQRVTSFCVISLKDTLEASWGVWGTQVGRKTLRWTCENDAMVFYSLQIPPSGDAVVRLLCADMQMIRQPAGEYPCKGPEGPKALSHLFLIIVSLWHTGKRGAALKH